MQSFVIESGIVAPILRDHIDTDAIIPKQYLKVITKTGFGQYLFDNWRYLEDRSPNPEFSLNQPAYAGAKFLLVGENFGCGSSREHAVWALDEFGIRGVIARSFGDIFYNNCFKNGVLPIALNTEAMDYLTELAQDTVLELTVDLSAQTVQCGEKTWSFDIDKFLKKAMLEGLDPIGQTLQYKNDIIAFEEKHRQQFPWLFN